MGTAGTSLSVLAPRIDLGTLGDRAHLVQFYESEAFLVDSVARFIGPALQAGDAAIVIATSEHRERLEETLGQHGVDVGRARSEGRYADLDAADTLARFMAGTLPDTERFRDVIGGTIDRALQVGRRVRAFGEMVALLWNDDKHDAAIRLEELWAELARTHEFSLLCAYPLGAFRREQHAGSFREICAKHSHVLPSESYIHLATPEERLRTVTSLQQKARALETETAVRRRTEKELADFVENAVEGLHRVGADGRILWTNRAMFEMLGYPADEYVGRHASEFHVERRTFDTLWDRLMRRESVLDHAAELRCKDGSTRHVLMHANGRWENDTFIHARCFIRDVTKQKHLEDALRGKLEQLNELDRRKDEFLAMLGHELRNPLSAVQNAIAIARLDPSRREHALEIARRQTKQLARLVDDLLDVARITQGRVALRTEVASLAQVIERAIDATRTLLEDGAHVLSVSLPADDVVLQADPARLEQVIVNLLMNAAKYTPAGGRVDVTVERQAAAVTISVRDTGIGIAPDVLPRVFDLFSQGERTADRTQGGLGIGLTVARKVVELHGGTITAHSDGPGRGAEFVVQLPAPVVPEATRARRAADSTDPHTARVLLVEDNADAAESLQMLLELLGHRVVVASDGERALAAARGTSPQIMLVDIGLPGMDGYEVARRIRSHPELRSVVLVALTGYGRSEDRERAFAAGFDHHLVKPINMDALEALVARVTRERQAPAIAG